MILPGLFYLPHRKRIEVGEKIVEEIKNNRYRIKILESNSPNQNELGIIFRIDIPYTDQGVNGVIHYIARVSYDAGTDPEYKKPLELFIQVSDNRKTQYTHLSRDKIFQEKVSRNPWCKYGYQKTLLDLAHKHLNLAHFAKQYNL